MTRRIALPPLNRIYSQYFATAIESSWREEVMRVNRNRRRCRFFFSWIRFANAPRIKNKLKQHYKRSIDFRCAVAPIKIRIRCVAAIFYFLYARLFPPFHSFLFQFHFFFCALFSSSSSPWVHAMNFANRYHITHAHQYDVPLPLPMHARKKTFTIFFKMHSPVFSSVRWPTFVPVCVCLCVCVG